MTKHQRQALNEALKQDGRKVGTKTKRRARTKMILALTLTHCSSIVKSWLVVGEGEHVVRRISHRVVCIQSNSGPSHKNDPERLCSHEYAVYRWESMGGGSA